jgi:hypothetical protein
VEITLSSSRYLTSLLADVARLCALHLPTDSDEDTFVRAALQLEGVHADTIPQVAAAQLTVTADTNPLGYATNTGSWQDTLKLAEVDTVVIDALRAHEVVGIANAAALTVDTSCDLFLRQLHATATKTLVEEKRHGAFRTFDVAVHDSGSGRVIYQPSTPDQIPHAWDALCQYVDTAEVNPVIKAAVVLYQLQVMQPFDAANGRVAVLAARHLLRHGIGAAPDVETRLAADRGGFHGEIAQTIRRRHDVTYFAERYAEALVGALRDQARDAGKLERTPTIARTVLAVLRDNPTVTVKDLPDDVTALLDAGVLTALPGRHGLTFTSHLAR